VDELYRSVAVDCWRLSPAWVSFKLALTFKHPIDKYHHELMASITATDGIVAKLLLDLKV
jgi:hypothetical protein